MPVGAAWQPHGVPPWFWEASWSVALRFVELAVELTVFDCVTLPLLPGLRTRTGMFVLLGSTCVAPEAADACCSLVADWPSACTPSAAFAASAPTERSSIRAPTT